MMKCLICKKGIAVNDRCMGMKVSGHRYSIHMYCEHEMTELRSTILLILGDWDGLWSTTVGFTHCDFCGLGPTPEGHDGCIGTLPGVMNACCGHGDTGVAYVQFYHDDYKNEPNKVRIAGQEALDYIEIVKGAEVGK